MSMNLKDSGSPYLRALQGWQALISVVEGHHPGRWRSLHPRRPVQACLESVEWISAETTGRMQIKPFRQSIIWASLLEVLAERCRISCRYPVPHGKDSQNGP